MIYLKLLQIRLLSINSLKKLTKNNINFIEWREITLNLLYKIFGDDPLVNEFKKIKFAPTKNLYQEYGLKSDFNLTFQEGLIEAEKILRKAVDKYLEKNKGCFENGINLKEIKDLIDILQLTDKEKKELQLEFEELFLKKDLNETVILNNRKVYVLNKININ